MPKNSITKLPFDPKGNIFRWGPVPGKFLYVCTFVEVHHKQFPAVYGEQWSETLELFKDGRIFWINDATQLEAAGRKAFVRYMLPRDSREKIYTEWLGDARAVTELEKEIDGLDLAAISDAELGQVWKKLNDAYIKFWTTGSVPELANYGSVEYLRKKLKGLVPDNEIGGVLETLTAPERLSFYQEEEVALAKTDDLAAHQKQFFWLKNSYAGTQVLPVEFFAERKKELRQNLEEEIEHKLTEVKARKAAVQKQFNLTQEIMEIAAAISYGIEWQDERKKYIFIILHYIDALVREVARRFGYDFERLHDLWHYHIGDIILGKDLRPELERRKNGFGVRFFHDCVDLYGDEVDLYWQTYGEENVTAGTTDVRGVVASKGKGQPVRGKITILLDPSNVKDFIGGDVLVAPMTSPEYVFAMKKACAVITDAGGLTSHAAIVSRELGIPCIVGTKIATKVFKDGDMVEVDAERGVVKKI
ncbi:MAG: hypothetical protein A3C90_00490 [Candidatus Magasanikbacteria bacterium RIFCSPHIGHO2_02_FULL_51_14]|uniref:PEP-utilising enzyme mobile domain-containing protein n=1 Tax=Candidatus Magasanikbacteria bacterium RIFCSPHIGHO2_02_FULL_51_14 TaxID=1798683 RepID=A0A1F6MHG5_9BACT|nr:MAG: hypothetical protein A3C90_00490 [Candidatus Magasanikbacteria bacterium RIFCSPHIGHO2_02_FULL_51_14]